MIHKIKYQHAKLALNIILLPLLTGLFFYDAYYHKQQKTATLGSDAIKHEQGKSYVFYGLHQTPSDSMDNSELSKLRLFENDRELGFAHALHADIRERGAGLYSHWNNSLLFSSSDNSDPRTNGRAYTIKYPLYSSWQVKAIAVSLFLILLLNYNTLLDCLVKIRAMKDTSPKSVLHLNFKLMITGVTFVILFLLLEVILRAIIPFSNPVWPCRDDEKLGYVFIPGATLQWTNFLDFYSIQKANSFGFLDREYDIEKPQGTFRILVLGDSFVEAAQIDINEKFHMKLEKLLNAKYPDRKFECIALGYSSCGTSNTISFYEEIGRKLKPDLVISLFIFNDFKNNSALLESIRNGWSPDATPRLYYRPTPNGFIRQDINKNWQKFKLAASIDIESGRIARKVEKFLGWSYVYLMINRYVEQITKSKVKYEFALYRKRYDELSRNPEYKKKLEGWDITKNPAIDSMFFAKNLPPVFADAVKTTKHCYKILDEEVKRNGGKLLIVTDDLCSVNKTLVGRETIDKGCFIRINNIASELGIPILDLHPAFVKNSLDAGHFKYDIHWNATGHNWAAQEVFNYLQNADDLLTAKSGSTNN